MSGATAKKLGSLPEPGGYRGLCATCAIGALCTFPRDPKRPVMNCDEFEGYEKGMKASMEAVHAAPSAPGDAAHPRDEKYKGLCSNCENRQGCTFPKPEGGVLNCEEYA
jgi:hypothetical protein